LHPFIETESFFASIGVDEDSNLDIYFELTSNVNELGKKLVNKKTPHFQKNTN
jgi:hypothetical protein